MNRFVATPLLTVFAFTLVVTLAGVLFAPSDVWPNLLIAGVFLSGLGLSAGFVVASQGSSEERPLPLPPKVRCTARKNGDLAVAVFNVGS
jgi:hypothetical protein